MPKHFRLNQPELAAAVATALSACQDVKEQQRLLAMRMAASGQFTAAQIAEQVGISRRQFFHWVNALKEGGVEGLLEREHGGGAPPQVHGQALEEFLAGLQEGRWKRAREIQQWLRQRHQIKLGLTGVHYWLGKLGGVLKVPRKAHARKNAEQVAEFQQQRCAKLKSWTIPSGKKVRIWVIDEHRYGLIPVVRKCWTLRGVRPVAPYQTKYQWGYLYSALEVDGDHGTQFLCLPGVGLDLSRLFLEQITASDPQAEHVVIQDPSGLSSQSTAPSVAGSSSLDCIATLQPGTQSGRSDGRSHQGSDWQYLVDDLGETRRGHCRRTSPILSKRTTGAAIGFTSLARQSNKRYRNGE
jgi:transposase